MNKYRDPQCGDIICHPETGEYLLIADFNEDRIIAYYFEEPNWGPRWVSIPYDLSMRTLDHEEYIQPEKPKEDPITLSGLLWFLIFICIKFSIEIFFVVGIIYGLYTLMEKV